MPTRNFDAQLRDKLLCQFGDDNGRRMASAYEQTRATLNRQVYGNIRGAEPDLSDHGIDHISNVQNNVICLLSAEDGIIDSLSGIEIYCLGMFILFHDAGNVYGRKGHHEKVGRLFDKIRGQSASHRREKTLIVRATRAHTGRAQDGSHDTLKELSQKDHLEGKPVRLRELAAILRFADELAEGPQRTSEFMQAENLYSPESRIFHAYANVTNILIDRGNKRIVLTYEIDVDPDQSEDIRRKNLSDILKFTYKRIIKLNQERQYAGYYSELLAPFRSTEVTFNFHCGDDVLDMNLDPLRLTDIIVPGDPTKEISDIDRSYSIETLINDVLSKCPRRSKS